MLLSAGQKTEATLQMCGVIATGEELQQLLVASCELPVAAPTATPGRALIKKPGRGECAEWELCCAAKAIAVVNKHFSA